MFDNIVQWCGSIIVLMITALPFGIGAWVYISHKKKEVKNLKTYNVIGTWRQKTLFARDEKHAAELFLKQHNDMIISINEIDYKTEEVDL